MVKATMLRDLTLAATVAAMLCAALAAALTPQPAAAQAASDGSQRAALRQACAADVRTLCAGVMPGGGRIKRCVIEKHDQLSEGCKSAMLSARALSNK